MYLAHFMYTLYKLCLLIWNQFLWLRNQNSNKYYRCHLLKNCEVEGCYRAQMFCTFLVSTDLFSVIIFFFFGQFFISSLSVHIMLSLCFSLQPEWLSHSATYLKVCDCTVLSLATYSTSKFLAPLSKEWTIYSLFMSLITTLFSLNLLAWSHKR